MSLTSATKIGEGVPRERNRTAKPKKAKPVSPNFPPEWSDKPTFPDQATRFPESVDVSAPQYAQFDLDKEGQIEALNKFLLDTAPHAAPKIALENQERQFCETTGSWKVLITYRRLRYKILLKTE